MVFFNSSPSVVSPSAVGGLGAGVERESPSPLFAGETRSITPLLLLLLLLLLLPPPPLLLLPPPLLLPP